MTKTSRVLEQRDRVQLQFSLPGFGEIEVSARVVWSKDDYAGLVFIDAKHDSRSAIERYVGDRLADPESALESPPEASPGSEPGSGPGSEQ